MDYEDFKEIIWRDHELPTIVLHIINELTGHDLREESRRNLKAAEEDKLKKAFDVYFKKCKDDMRVSMGLLPHEPVYLNEDDYFCNFK